jgi:CHAT domain-containing protein
MVRGDLVEAGHQAKEGFDKFSPLSVEWAWRFRILEAEILVYRKMNQEALSILNSPLPESLSSGDEAIREDMVEALALERLGRNQEADEHLRKAEQLCQLEHSKLDGQLGQFEGVIAVDRGHFAEADVLFRRCLRSARTQKDEVLEAIALLNLGLSALKQEHYDSAISWSTDAYQAARTLEAHFAEEKILGNLGVAYSRMGDAEKSAFYFQQAANEARELDAKNDLVKWDIALADVFEKMNQASAENYYQQALALAQKSEDTGDLVDVLTAIAATSLAHERWDKATYYSQWAIGLCQSHGDHLRELDVLLIEGKIAAHQNDATRAQQLFREIAADQQSNMALKWEAQESLARLYEDEHRTADAERQYKIALATFQNARASLQDEELRLPFLSNAAHLQDDYVHFLVSQRKSVKALQVADYSRAQTLAEGLGSGHNVPASQPSAMKNPQRLAAELDATILFYWLGPQYSYLWVVSRNHVALLQLPSTASIDTLVRNYLNELHGPRDVLEAASENGRDLYNSLVAPARQEIAETSRILIIPDGALNDLNFETLLVAGPKLHYLIEDTTIVNASSLRLVTLSSQARSGRRKLLLLGDPISPNDNYPELPDAAVEINRIESHFAPSDRTAFTRGEATTQAYLNSNPEQFSYIHFAAHATASTLSPLDSAVILSKLAPEDDSFKLYARDIVRRPVQADLVTISACYGAGARRYTGEGLVGLSWAFLRAGAHNVIAALWQTSDSATPQLMDRLYGELAAGHSPDAALRAAKMSLLHSDSVFRKPVYWAPFQLYSYQLHPVQIVASHRREWRGQSPAVPLLSFQSRGVAGQ